MIPTNQYELAARAKKVTALADLLDAHGITAVDAGSINTMIWTRLAERAHVNPPSIETIAGVIEALESRAIARTRVAAAAAGGVA